MGEIIASAIVFLLAAVGLAAGMLLGGRGLRGGCRGGSGDHAGGCGQDDCCQNTVPEPPRPPLVQIQGPPSKPATPRPPD